MYSESFPFLAKNSFASIGLKKQLLEHFILKYRYSILSIIIFWSYIKVGMYSLKPIYTWRVLFGFSFYPATKKQTNNKNNRNPSRSALHVCVKRSASVKRQGTRSHLPRCGMKMVCTSPPWVPPLRKSGEGGWRGLWIPGITRWGQMNFWGNDAKMFGFGLEWSLKGH